MQTGGKNKSTIGDIRFISCTKYTTNPNIQKRI